MARKINTDITPARAKFRDKRKWQIALRRYVLEKNKSPNYAPYFGLDIKNLRTWFEMQFENGAAWDNFAEKWQFDHIIPVTYFNFEIEEELRLCWNFTNIRVELIQRNRDRGHRLDILAAKKFFEELYQKTRYRKCLELLEKISRIELADFISTEKQQQFIINNKPYLDIIENYSAFEFERLNIGKSVTEVLEEVNFLKKF